MDEVSIIPERTCGDCAECCKGWLWGEAHGHEFYPGRPCHFLNGTCSIYKNRPQDPCKSYKCFWLSDNILPMWMRPDKVKAIVTPRENKGINYLDVIECGQTLSSEVLSWLVMWALNNEANLHYRINGGSHRIGSKEFLEM